MSAHALDRASLADCHVDPTITRHTVILCVADGRLAAAEATPDLADLTIHVTDLDADPDAEPPCRDGFARHVFVTMQGGCVQRVERSPDLDQRGVHVCVADFDEAPSQATAQYLPSIPARRVALVL